MNSLTLLELLRRRSALPVEEIGRLLDELPALLDAAERLGDWPAAHLLGAVRVVFENDTPRDGADRPVGEWPAFRLDLLADVTQGETMAEVETLGARSRHDPPACLAALLYELLGGPHRSDGAHPPLAALDEVANRTLQRALAGGGFANCAEFWREFRGSPAEAARTVRIPVSLLGSGVPGTALKLTPGAGGTPLRLVARPHFRIGRSRAEADLITRFLPETPENDARTHELGRVHVLGEIIGGSPALRDGNGTQPSTNGSLFDGQPLAADAPRPVRQRGVLDLAGRFTFEVIPQLATAEDFAMENLAAWKDGATRSGSGAAAGESRLCGAILFAASAGQPFVREAVWLFTRVDFSIGENDAPVWLPPSRHSPAVFLHREGCFWIVNAALPVGKIRLDGRPLAPGEAAPVGAKASLGLNAREFSLEVK